MLRIPVQPELSLPAGYGFFYFPLILEIFKYFEFIIMFIMILNFFFQGRLDYKF